MEVIIVAIISGLCTAIPSIITSLVSSKKNQDLINYRITELTNHVNAHNNLIDRMYKIENRVTLLEERKS